MGSLLDEGWTPGEPSARAASRGGGRRLGRERREVVAFLNKVSCIAIEGGMQGVSCIALEGRMQGVS